MMANFFGGSDQAFTVSPNNRRWLAAGHHNVHVPSIERPVTVIFPPAGISGLSLAGQEGLKTVHAALNISADAVEALRRAQARWRDLPPVKAVD